MNLDGKNDSLHFNIEVPLADSEAIHSVQLLLIFDYQLHVSEILNLDSTGQPRGEVVGGGLLGLIFAGYVLLPSQSPYPIIAFSVPI